MLKLSSEVVHEPVDMEVVFVIAKDKLKLTLEISLANNTSLVRY